jgi:hypothetical protein
MGDAELRILRDLVRHHKKADVDPLTPLLDEYYLKRPSATARLKQHVVDLQQRPRPGGRLSPSKICGCERQGAFAFVGMPGKTVIDPQQEAVFDDGNWRHHKWDATFLDMELVLGPKRFKVISIEEYIELPHLYIAGHLDAVISIGGVHWVVDFKGINMWGFDRVFRDTTPLEAHVLQLICYMKARKVRRGILLYDDKNSNRQQVFSVHFTNKRWREVQEWCERVIRRIDRQEIPPAAVECQSGTMLFERCPWAGACWGNKSLESVRKRMYRDFDGLEEAWLRGKAIVAAHNTPDDA